MLFRSEHLVQLGLVQPLIHISLTNSPLPPTFVLVHGLPLPLARSRVLLRSKLEHTLLALCFSSAGGEEPKAALSFGLSGFNRGGSGAAEDVRGDARRREEQTHQYEFLIVEWQQAKPQLPVVGE